MISHGALVPVLYAVAAALAYGSASGHRAACDTSAADLPFVAGLLACRFRGGLLQTPTTGTPSMADDILDRVRSFATRSDEQPVAEEPATE